MRTDNKIYSYDENFFEEINTPEKAYFLGLLYADGTNVQLPTTKTMAISLQEQDVSILERFKLALKSDYPLLFMESRNEKHSNVYRLYVYGNKICDDLTKWGCVENKSLILTFPTFLSDELLSHFIRGYFDGDGCVWSGKRKFMKFKSRPNGRIIHNVKFTFTGATSFISGLQKVLCWKLGFRENKLNPYIGRKCEGIVCTMEYSGRGNLKKLYDFMYKDCEDLYITRKKKKFEEIFCALDEKSSSETGLIAGTPEMVISSQAVDNTEGSSTIPEMEVESSDSKCPALNE